MKTYKLTVTEDGEDIDHLFLSEDQLIKYTSDIVVARLPGQEADLKSQIKQITEAFAETLKPQLTGE